MVVSPKHVNDLNHVLVRSCEEQFYKYGLSTLHNWIRFSGYILYVIYNMDFKKDSARTAAEKEFKTSRKHHVQTALKLELSLTVDVVKQGCVTTNTDNMATAFFTNYKATAKSTSVDKNLIIRLHNIM